MDLVDRLVRVLVLDQVLLRLLDGDREVGSRLLVESNCTFMDFLGIQIYMYEYMLVDSYSDEDILIHITLLPSLNR
jgi:hypothetical protein